MNYSYSPSPHVIEKRNKAIQWARNILANKGRYLIVDTETSGIKDDDVIVHFAVMDLDRNMIIDTQVRPTRKKRINPVAQQMHGFSIKDLKDAPIFEKVLEQFLPMAEGKTLLSYRAIFHSQMIDQTIEQDGIARLYVGYSRFECIQEQYEAFYDRGYLAMPGRDNTGIGDCNAALDVIEEMATAETRELPQKQEVVVPQKISKWDSENRAFGIVLTCVAIAFLFGELPVVAAGIFIWALILFFRSK